MVKDPDGVQVPGRPVRVYVTFCPETTTTGVVEHTWLSGAMDTTAREGGTISWMEIDEVPAGAVKIMV
jgi:hypothetical protein